MTSALCVFPHFSGNLGRVAVDARVFLENYVEAGRMAPSARGHYSIFARKRRGPGRVCGGGRAVVVVVVLVVVVVVGSGLL